MALEDIEEELWRLRSVEVDLESTKRELAELSIVNAANELQMATFNGKYHRDMDILKREIDEQIKSIGRLKDENASLINKLAHLEKRLRSHELRELTGFRPAELRARLWVPHEFKNPLENPKVESLELGKWPTVAFDGNMFYDPLAIKDDG